MNSFQIQNKKENGKGIANEESLKPFRSYGR